MKTLLCAAVLLGTSAVDTAMAMEPGDWLFRFGASYIDPKSNNHELVTVSSDTQLTFNFSYMMTENWATEVLLALPFKHDIMLDDGTKVGSTKHLPPTVSLQYHFAPGAKFQPYVGAGVNYTRFFSVQTTGPLEGTSLGLDSSFGIAGQVGADVMLNDQWFLNLDVRYISIETDASVNGADIGKVKISPWVYGLNVGLRF